MNIKFDTRSHARAWTCGMAGSAVLNRQPSCRHRHRASRVAWLVCLAGMLVACGAGEAHDFSEAVSPDGRWVLRVTVAAARMPQGRFHIAAYLSEGQSGAAQQILTTTLENDGVPFTEHNIALRWTSAQSALLCLRASDLPDRGLRIKPGPPPVVSEVERC